MGFKMDGFDDLINELGNKAKKAKDLDGKTAVTFAELFSDAFMTKYTKHDSITTFFEESPFGIEGEDDFDKIDVKRLDEWVSDNTSFNSWEDMKGEAAVEYYASKLGF